MSVSSTYDIKVMVPVAREGGLKHVNVVSRSRCFAAMAMVRVGLVHNNDTGLEVMIRLRFLASLCVAGTAQTEGSGIPHLFRIF